MRHCVTGRKRDTDSERLVIFQTCVGEMLKVAITNLEAGDDEDFRYIQHSML